MLPVVNGVDTGTITTVGQTVKSAILSGYTSYCVQVIGTITAGSLILEFSNDGVNYDAANTSKANLGNSRNNITVAGLYRGSCGSLASVQVRASGTFVGSAAIRITTSVGNFVNPQNELALTQDQLQNKSTVAGGNTAYSTTVGVQTVAIGGGNLILLRNPTGSGVDLYIDKVVISSDSPGRIERVRQPTVTAVTTASTNSNKGGAASTGAALSYIPANATITAATGVIEKVSYLAATATEEAREAGSIILRPTQDLLIRYIQTGGTAVSATAQISWWESAALV